MFVEQPGLNVWLQRRRRGELSDTRSFVCRSWSSDLRTSFNICVVRDGRKRSASKQPNLHLMEKIFTGSK